MKGTSPEEAELLREAREFLRVKVRELEAMLEPSRQLRAKLAQTESYRRVDGLDEAQLDPAWDTHSTLEICFERAVEELIESLTDATGRATPEPRRRRRPMK